MIASAENGAWPDDVRFGDTYMEAGLPAPSLIRPCKLATIEGGRAEKIGRVSADLMAKVAGFLLRSLRS
jgi:mRNA interferase MazF